MNICVAQTRPVKGDIQGNIEGHERLIDLAVSMRAGIVIFPELSITGYEPELAEELATDQDDPRFDVFQRISDAERITIGVGAPTRHDGGICISMVLFQPHSTRHAYSKQYLHSDEEPYFVAGEKSAGLLDGAANVALAICYELSVPAHSERARANGAETYIASVAKSAGGVDAASNSLSEIARKRSMTAFMANCIGECGGIECAGGSSIWNRQGALVGRLSATHEGVLMLDTDTHEVCAKAIEDVR